MEILEIGSIRIPYTVQINPIATRKKILFSEDQMTVVLPEATSRAELRFFLDDKREFILKKWHKS